MSERYSDTQQFRDDLDRWITREDSSGDETYEDEAYARGVDVAKAAATWITNGNESDESRRAKLRLIENGDPRIDEHLPAYPTLSGEWADDPTPLSLARDITGEDDPTSETIDAIANAFEEGVSDTFQTACETELRKWTDD